MLGSMLTFAKHAEDPRERSTMSSLWGVYGRCWAVQMLSIIEPRVLGICSGAQNGAMRRFRVHRGLHMASRTWGPAQYLLKKPAEKILFYVRFPADRVVFVFFNGFDAFFCFENTRRVRPQM